MECTTIICAVLYVHAVRLWWGDTKVDLYSATLLATSLAVPEVVEESIIPLPVQWFIIKPAQLAQQNLIHSRHLMSTKKKRPEAFRMSDLSLLPPQQQEAILNGPALQPPAGVDQNLDNPPNNNAIPHAVIPICLFLATLAILVRTYTKIFIVRRINVDDGESTPISSIYITVVMSNPPR